MAKGPEDFLNQWSEQLGALTEVAVFMWQFYEKLTEQGFTEDQALTIVIAQLTSSLQPQGDS
jgi:hypothetical protein